MQTKNTQFRINGFPQELISSSPVIQLSEHRTLLINNKLSAEMELTTTKVEELLKGSNCHYDSPKVTVYAGHQFGNRVAQLGDDRAHLVGEVSDSDGQLHDLQLKGSGKTPFSRMGDGLAVLSSSVREYFASEHLHALGVPTSRTLGVATSTHPVIREQVETAAKVLRSAPSFLRFGHFEWPINIQKPDINEKLFSYVVKHFFPQYQGHQRKVALVYTEICKSTAKLLAHWMANGFCHGIMNTDNMSIHGITIDYGPYGFMEDFDLHYISNQGDHEGRYSFQNQPPMAHWNLQVLGECFQKLDAAKGLDLKSISNQFVDQFNVYHRNLMLRKLGIGHSQNQSVAEDQLKLIQSSIKLLHTESIDYTFFWRTLSKYQGDRNQLLDLLEKAHSPCFLDFLNLYDYHLNLQKQSIERYPMMNRSNPYVVLKNHFAKDIIDAAKEEDLSFLQGAYHVLTNPFAENLDWSSYARSTP